MQLRFGRSQAVLIFGRIRFNLRAEAVLSDEENFVLNKYKLRHAALVLEDTPELLKKSIRTGIIVSIIISVLLYGFLAPMFPTPPSNPFLKPVPTGISVIDIVILAGFVLFILVTLIHYNKYRQNIYVHDLLRGRTFKCKSIVELAQKEAYLQVVCDFLRQVLQTAQHWDGKETVDIEPMNPEEAKAAIIRGL